MSPLLAVAIVLLVLVVGLTLLQRRAQAQAHPPRRQPSQPPPVAPDPAAPSSPAAVGTRTDPLLGLIEFHDGHWMTANDFDLHGALVLVEIAGTIDGPTDDDREIVRAARARPDLDARARALVIPELERRQEDTSGVSPCSLSIRPDDHGVRHGFLWYDPGEFLGEIGVKSADQWQTLHLVVEE